MDKKHTLPLITQQLEGNENQTIRPEIDNKKFADSIDLTNVSFTKPDTPLGISEINRNGDNAALPKLITYYDYRITDKTDIPPLIPIIIIAGEVLSTEGNITTISGASKSGKSAAMSVFVAGAISEDGLIDGFNEVVVELNNNKRLSFILIRSRPDISNKIMSKQFCDDVN